MFHAKCSILLAFAGLCAAAPAVDHEAAAQQLRPTAVGPTRRPQPQPVVPVALGPLPSVGTLAPVTPPQLAPGDQFFNQSPDGQFSSGFRSADGTAVFMQGDLVPTTDGKDVVIVKRGAYSYITPEGRTINVRYVADHLGFRVEQGDQRV
ncbi:larval cuticle protein 1-like [Neocloeon triangulifer]|uniref:larval cuticle protein 1-like n=1 Tax=Neocloeon triangulifer TaxID=2078957 RepID=UPI00286EC7C6|nr:larval cuticle protein 1-like [Neocloeon triangulifer]